MLQVVVRDIPNTTIYEYSGGYCQPRGIQQHPYRSRRRLGSSYFYFRGGTTKLSLLSTPPLRITPPPVPVLACRREERLVGEGAKDKLFIEENMEGVKGVLASERARPREGVFGWLYIFLVRESKEEMNK